MDTVCYVLEECATIRNIVLVAGIWYLLRTAVWLITSLWSGTKAFILSDLFRAKLKPSSYGWAGKECISCIKVSICSVM